MFNCEIKGSWAEYKSNPSGTKCARSDQTPLKINRIRDKVKIKRSFLANFKINY